MTRTLSILFIAISTISFSQINVATKANLLFPTAEPTWKSVSSSAVDAYEATGENNVGFNVGLSVKIGLVGNLSLMPEIYYTTFKNDFTDPISNTTLEVKNNRADMPILLAYNVIKPFDIFAGPVASYNLSTDNQYNDFKENAKNEFTAGFQIGVQFQIKKLIFTGRYEGAFTEDQREFINNNSGQTIRYDNRPSLFIAGVGYEF